MKNNIYSSFQKATFLFSMFFLLLTSTSLEAQIFPAAPANATAGNPDAIVPVTGVINAGVFTAQTPEACVQGDNINFSGYGEDPEWRFDIAIPSGSGPISPSCSNIEIRVCRRGDFGQTAEATFVYDEAFNQIGLIPGHPSNSTAFDCTDAPICTTVTLDPCAFNTQVDDGIWSVTLYTNGSLSGNSVGDFCAPAAGPQADGDAANCTGDCPTYTQSVAGIFDNQASGGPMVDANCVGCNCAFIDYIKMDIAISDTTFTMSATEQGVGKNIDLTPAVGLTCPQDWTVNGGTTGLAATSGTTTFTTTTPGTYTICNNVGLAACQEQNCKTVTFAAEICDNGIDDDFDGLIDCNDPDCGPSGDCDICYDEENAVEYKINSVSGATTYSWTVPSGAVITSQPADTFIIVDYSAATVGLDSVKVIASDAVCNKDSISYFQNIIFCNDPPVANDDMTNTDENVAIGILVLNNDSDPDNALDISSINNTGLVQPSNGSVAINTSTGEIIYTPNPNYNGADNFEYTICDVLGLCDTATVSVSIAPLNDPPVATDDIVSVDEDAFVTFGVVGNDDDPNDPLGNIDPTTVSIFTNPTNGMVSVDPVTGDLTYTPNPNFWGMDTLEYIVCDDGNPLPPLCDTAEVVITINSVDDFPFANTESVTTDEDVATTINVSSNDDFGGDGPSIGSISVSTNPSNGTVSVDDNATPNDPTDDQILYTPDPNYNGTDNFIYQICDSDNDCDTAIVNIIINPTPDPPVANADSETTDEDTAVTIFASVNDTDIDPNLDPTTVNFACSICTTPTNGFLINNGDGSVTYTPNPNFFGTENFIYQICDASGLCDTSTIDILINPIPDPPVALDDVNATPEDVAVVVSVLSNDSDLENDIVPSTVTVLSSPTNGTTIVDPLNGNITYQPNGNYNGLDQFEYVVCDATGLCDTAIVDISIAPTPDSPVAVDDADVTDEDTPVTTSVVANDSDPDNDIDPASVAVLATPANGTTSVDPVTGDITYTPNPNFNGTDTYTYQVCDMTSPSPSCDIATVTITVDPQPDAPVATDDFDVTDEDTPVVIDVAANDSDPIDSPLGGIDPTSVIVITPSANGTTSVDPVTGEITFTPTVDFNGTTTFEYQICDTDGLCDTALVTVDVLPVNDPPVAIDDLNFTNEETTVATTVSGNDFDIDGNLDPLAVTLISNPLNGVANLNASNGQIIYTPSANYNGLDSMDYSICDTDGLCDTATLVIEIFPVVDGVVASDDNAMTTEEVAVTTDVLANDNDPDNDIDTSSVAVVTPSANGTTSVNPLTGEITYTPNPNFNGADSYSYEVCDLATPTPNCDIATVFITVDPVNDAPVAIDDNFTTPENTMIVMSAIGNDDDPDDPLGNIDPSSVVILASPTNGTATVNSVTGEINYTPNTDYNGTDVLTYIVCDDGNPLPALCDTATVNIVIDPTNNSPIAVDDAVTTDEETPVTVDVAINDSDPNDPAGNIDPSSVSITTPPTNGTTSIDPITGEITYTPNPDFYGTDVLEYQICDDGNPLPAQCDIAEVVFTVNPINDTPVAADDAATTPEDTPVTIDVAGNDSDPNDPLGNIDPSTVSIFTNPTNGTANVNPVTGAVTYTPTPGFNGTDSLVYEICDDGNPLPALCSTATIYLNITDVNDPPVAIDDSDTTQEDTPMTITVVSNDTDSDGTIDPTSVTIITPSANGTTSVDPITGEIIFTPNANFNGTTTFEYQVCDDDGACDIAEVTVLVNPTNDPPVAVDDSNITNEDTPVSTDVAFNDSDIDGNLDPTTLAILTNATNGNAVISAGEINYVPNANFTGTDMIEYSICDADGLCDTAILTINILPVSDLINAQNDSDVTTEETPVVTSVLSNDTDADNDIDTSSVAILTPPSNGTTSIDPLTGEITYTPDPNFNGNESYEYQICDMTSPIPNCDNATVFIVVDPVNDAPIANDLTTTIAENTPYVVDLSTIADDPNDPLGNIDPTTLILISPTTNGTTSIDPITGDVTYTPDPNFNGTDSYTYVICDDGNPLPALCDTGVVVLNISPVNNPPVALDDNATTDEDIPVSVNVLLNDDDPNDPLGNIDPTTIAIITPPANGTTSIDPITGEITYTPNPGFNGNDILEYVVCDDGNPLPPACDTATLNIMINDLNDVPVAIDDTATTPEDTPILISVPTNDTDSDGTIDPASVTIITPSANGTTSIDPVTGEITFTPDPNFNGTTTFEYQICDDDGACDIAEVTVNVSPENDPPVAVDDVNTTNEEVSVTTAVASNDSDVDGNLDPTTTTILTAPTNGTASANPTNGSIIYTPNTNYNGLDSIEYSICDTDGLCDTAWLVITIQSVVDAVVASDDFDTTDEDTPVTTSVLTNDNDPDNDLDPTSVSVISPSANGSTSIDLVTGEITYTPDPDFNGTDSYSYQVCDLATPTPNCDIATVFVTVNPINDDVVAVDDSFSTPEDAPVVLNVIGNDNDPTDPNGNVDPTSVSILQNPTNGTASVNPTTGEITYTPNPEFNGNDTLTYIVCDDGNPLPATCDTAQVIIIVDPINDAPVAVDDAGTTDEDTPVTVDVATNDTDPTDPTSNIDPTSVSILTNPTNGTAGVNPTTGEITYTPDPDFNGTDVLTYTICDSGNPLPAACDTAQVTFTINPINDNPIATDDNSTLDENTSTTVDVVDNDDDSTDPSGNIDPTTVVIITPSANGTTSVDPVTGEISYTPNTDFNGTDSLQYIVCDDGNPLPATCDTATVYFNITPANNPPVAMDDAVTTDEDVAVMINILANDDDPNDPLGNIDPTSVSILTNPSNGSTFVDPTSGVLTYAPDSNFNGTDILTYVVCDNGNPLPAACDTATVTITIDPINDNPIAIDDTAITDEDTPTTVSVISNDGDPTDPSGNIDPTTVAIVDPPTNGTTSVDPITGDITYTPDPNFNGNDTLTYVVCDDGNPLPATCDTAILVLIVNEINDAPVAIDDAENTNEDTPVVISVPTNDTDFDGTIDPTSVTIITPSANGTTSVDPITGEITFTPNTGFNGAATFEYQICDNDGACDTAEVVVNVTPVNDPPIANDDFNITTEDNPAGTVVVLNDTDVDGNLDITTINVISPPTNGTTVLNPSSGEIIYVPNSNFNGVETFEYSICDTDGLCDTATVEITVTSVEDPIVVQDDTDNTLEDTPVVTSVLNNDFDPDENLDSNSIVILTPPANGTTSVDPTTGEITFTPDPNFNGNDSYTYQVCDDASPIANCDNATVFITVDPVNDPPVAGSTTIPSAEDSTIIINVVDTSSDPNDPGGSVDPTTVTVITPPTNGTVTVDPTTGEVTFVPDPNSNGVDSFTYVICDTGFPLPAACDTGTIVINVTSTNDPPVANDDFNVTNEEVSVTTLVAANDTDVDGNIDPTTVIVIMPSANATTTVNPTNGAIIYTPNSNFNGLDSVEYSICDSDGLCDTATLVIDILPTVDIPVAVDDNGTTMEDTPLVTSVLDNDTDGDNDLDTSSVAITTPPANGTTSVDPVTGEITYTPNPDFNGTDSYTYQVCDLTSPTPNCDIAEVFVTVDPVNDAPSANDDNVLATEDTPTTFDPTTNDDDTIDPLGNIDPSTVAILQNPTNGSVSLDPITGAITYTPNLDFNGTDSLQYAVCDDGNPLPALCDTAMVYFNVQPENDAPVATDDVASVDEDGTVAIDVTANDNDPTDPTSNIDPTTVSVLENPTNGTTSVDPITGEIIYTPNPNFNGIDTLTYVVCDDGNPLPAACDTAQVIVTVNPVNDNTIAIDDVANTDEDTPVTVDVATNDSDSTDPSGGVDPTTVSVITPPTNGITSVDPTTGAITYTPNPNFNGTDSLTYVICDTGNPLPATCDTATVIFNVGTINDAPVANDDSDTTPEEVPVTIDVVANDTDLDGTIDPTTVAVLTNPTNGTTSVDPVTGVVTYSPELDFNGMNTFAYQVCDNEGLCDTATITIDVTPVNDPPVAIDDATITAEESTVTTNVTGNDYDVDGNLDISTINIITPVNNGLTLVNTSTGDITYSPTANFNGLDSLEYAVCDSDGLCDTATFVINVISIADAIIANDDGTTTDEDMSVVTNILLNDVDPDNDIDTAGISIINQPINGTVSVDPITGEITYTPAPNFNGVDVYTYEVCDLASPTPHCDDATVTVTVNPVNDDPVAIDDVVATDEDNPIVISVLVNDNDSSDPAGNIDPSTLVILQNPTNGTTSVDPVTGEVTYTPDVDFNGVDSFTYVICDDGNPLPTLCDTATVTVNVNPINDNPIAMDDTSTTDEDTPVTVAITTNDGDTNDPSGGIDSTSVSIVISPTNGIVTVDTITGDLTYTPNPNFNGTDSLEYVICDIGNPLPSTCDTALVVFTINDVNDFPIVIDDTTTTDEDNPVIVDVLGNDVDLDGTIDPTTVTITSNPPNGTVSVDPISGEITYTPNPDFNGTDVFEYQVCDDDGACETAMVTVNITPVNDQPIAVDDSNITFEETPIITAVVDNDSDVDGNLDATTVAVIGVPNNGFTLINPSNGDVTYIPNINWNGVDTFTYQICDTDGWCDTAMVEITVLEVPDDIDANNDFAITDEDNSVTTAVLTNDLDPDNDIDTNSVAIDNPPANGTVSIDPITGDITYTPDPDFYGNDSYTYQVCDMTTPIANCDIATVTVTINPINDTLTTNLDLATTDEDTPVAIDVLANDDDPSDPTGNLNPATVLVNNAPTNGTTSVDLTTGVVTYLPNPDFHGVDTFTYTICDDGFPMPATCGMDTVIVTVLPQNDAPIAIDNAAVLSEDNPITFSIIFNDDDPNDPLGNIDPTTVSILENPINGIATVDPISGDLTYTPNPDFNGTDTLTYIVCDDGNPLPAMCDTAMVTFEVLPVNDTPVFVNGSGSPIDSLVITLLEDGSDTTCVAFEDIDLLTNSDNLTCSIIGNATNGTATLLNDSCIIYTPNPDFNGTDVVTKVVCDDAGVCDTLYLVYEITPINDAPVAVDDFNSTLEDNSVGTFVLINDSDIDGNLDPNSIAVVDDTANGTTFVNLSTGQIIYIPDANFNGNDTLTYSICDTDGLCDTAMVVILVLPVEDPVDAQDDADEVDEDSFVITNVLENDVDPDFNIDSTSVNVVGAPSNGTTSVDPVTGAITYTPDSDFNGVDIYEYEVCDLANPANCDIAQVVITVNPTNDNPVAVDDTFFGNEDSTFVVNVTTNDDDPTDPSGGIDPTSVAIVAPPANGTATVDPTTGEITYIPNDDFNGNDTLIYSVCDTGNPFPALCDSAMVIFTVDPVNDNPIANNDTASVLEDSTIVINVTANDGDPIDPAGGIDPTSIGIITPPTNGTVTVDPITGEVTYTPNMDFHGTDSLAYVVCDTGNPLPALCDTAMVFIEVGFVNDTPVFVDGNGLPIDTLNVTMTEDIADTTCMTVADIDVFSNNDTLTCAIISPPNNGTVTVLNDTCLIYQANPNYNGMDTLVKVICDSYGACDTLVVIYEVTPTNDNPIAVDDEVEAHEDNPIEITVTTNDGDPIDPAGGIDPTSVGIITPSANGTTTIDPTTGVITYLPILDFFGLDTFTYVVCDTGNPLPALCDTATVIVNVLPDTDEDGIVDVVDQDDDNDGIPDVVENGGIDPTGDDDNDGVYNYEDTDCTGCGYTSTDDNNDGIPDTFDFDGDGIPNSYDLDSDKDGIADVIEAGGDDTDGNGMLDGFIDANGNGLADLIDPLQGGIALPMWNTDATGLFNFLDIDSDGDGLVDNIESQPSVGYVAPFNLDLDGNGWDDAYDGNAFGTPVPLTNTDGLGDPDYMDLDSDDDGLLDAVEGHDANFDGIADTTPVGSDTDGDGLDDAYDLFNGITTINALASNAPIQDTDSDTQPDYRDTDSDNDGISDNDECPAGINCPDIDNDGIPDYLDLICNEFLAQPLVTISNPVCENDTIVMFVQNEYLTNILQMDTSDIMFYWFNGNGDTIAIQQEDIFSFAANDALAVSPFSVQVTVEGCISPISAPVEVEVIEIPVVTATNNGAICEGDAVQLSAQLFPNATYEWRVEGTTAIISTEREPVLNNINTTTTYQVNVYAAPCMTPGIATTTVEVETLPTVAPIANYTLNSDCSPADLTLMANATSDTTLTFEWTGPNGFISNEENPTIVNVDESFNGAYTLTVTSPMGCSATGSFSINNITNAPTQPIITASGFGSCEGADIELSVPLYAGSNVNYNWFRNGNFVSSGTNVLSIPNATTIDAGIYMVQITVDDCTLTSPTFDLEIATPPSIVVAQPDIVWCANGTEEILLDATVMGGTAPHSFEWNGPNNFYSVNEDPVLNNVNFETSGSYTVWVTDANGCQDSISVEVDVIDGPTTPIINSSGPTCEGGTIVLSVQEYAGVLLDYVWETPTGITTNISGLSTNELIISPVDISHEGNYIITVTVDSCTTISDTFNLILFDNIIAAPSTTTTPLCKGDNLSLTANSPNADNFEWAGPNGFTSNAENPTISNVTIANNGTYTLVVTNIEGCQSTASVDVNNIIAIPTTPTITTNSPVCEDGLIELSVQEQYNGNIVFYNWTNGAGQSFANGSTVLIPADDPSAIPPFRVTVTVDGCASDLSDPAEVTINPLPIAIANNGGDICEGDDAQLFGNTISGASYFWKILGSNDIISTEQNPIIFGLENTTTYELSVVVDGCGNINLATTTVTVNENPTATPSASYTLNSDCSPSDLQLFANATGGNGSYTFEWTGPNGFVSNIENPTIANATTVNNGSYTVMISDENGCETQASLEVNGITDAIAQPVITATPPTCDGETMTISVPSYSGSNVVYSWTTPNNVTTNISGLNSNELIISPVEALLHEGGYAVEITIDDCVVTSDIFNVVFPDQPQATPAYTIDGNCQNGNLQLFANATNVSGNVIYEWTGPNGFTSNAENPFINNALAAANGAYNLVVTNSNSCSISENLTVTGLASPPETPVILTNSPVCENGTIHMAIAQQYPSNAIFSWYNATGDIIGNGLEVDLSASDALAVSPYTVETTVNGCTSDLSNQADVEILPVIAITAFNSSPVCEEGEVQLFATEVPNATYQWFIAGTTTVISNEQFPTIAAPTVTTDYFVEITTDYECLISSTAYTTVEISPNPVISNMTGGGIYCEGETVNLSAEISEEGTYTWTGPNGFIQNGSTGASSPYSAIATLAGTITSGTYTLITTSTFGCESDLATVQVEITPLPSTPELTVTDDAICEGDLLELNTTAFNGTSVSYEWYFNGVIFATTNTPTHLISNTTILNTGQYAVQVILDGCTSPVSNEVYVNVFGGNTIIEPWNNSSSTNALCEGDDLQLNIPIFQNATYQWFGPAGFTSTEINPYLENVTTASAGDYFAVVTLNGCAVITTPTTTVYINPTPATPTITTNSPICEGSDLVLSVSSPLVVPTDSSMIFYWYASGTNQLIGTTYESFLMLENATDILNGNYYLVMSLNGCESDATGMTTAEVMVIPPNDADAGEDIELCAGTITNLDGETPTVGTGFWTSPTGATIANPELANTEVLDLIEGENIFIWTLSNGVCENYDSDTMIVTLTQASADNADAGIDFDVCNVNDVTLSANLPVTANGSWTQAANQASQGVLIVNSNDPNTQILGLTNGNTYTFTWTLSEGNCIDFDSDEVVITTYDIPIENAFITMPEFIYLCDAEDINLEAIAPTTASGMWSVNTDALIVNAALNNTIAADLETGENIFVWSLSNGVCEGYSSDTIYIYVEDAVEANNDHYDIIFNDSLMQANLLENDYLDNVNEWKFSISRFPDNGTFEFDENGIINYIPNPNFFGSDTLIYRLCNINCPTECDTALVTFDITGVSASGECFIPNVMTPDGDGVNDFFTVPCLDTYDESNVTIFNRWGDEVFRATPYNNDWDGTYNGKELPAGTYFYILDVKINGSVQNLQGYITLFR